MNNIDFSMIGLVVLYIIFTAHFVFNKRGNEKGSVSRYFKGEYSLAIIVSSGYSVYLLIFNPDQNIKKLALFWLVVNALVIVWGKFYYGIKK